MLDPSAACAAAGQSLLSGGAAHDSSTGLLAKVGPRGPPMGDIGSSDFSTLIVALVTLYGLNMVELCETALRILRLPWFDFVQDAP
jgi:hypothetical protein